MIRPPPSRRSTTCSAGGKPGASISSCSVRTPSCLMPCCRRCSTPRRCASLLHQSAHVVDGLLGRAGALPSTPELDQGRAMAAAAGTYEGKLEAARAWVNEQLYLAYLSVFSGAATAQDAERHLTALAEEPR